MVWDAIVIGSGPGGLAAGAAFARAGRRVMVLERAAGFGGAATVYRAGELSGDASLHEIDGAGLHGPTGAIARRGLADQVQRIATDVFCEVRSARFPAPVRLPHGLKPAEAVLAGVFPGSRPGLAGWFALLARLAPAMDDLDRGR
jgi:phytoene dehydrogenase-like protein